MSAKLRNNSWGWSAESSLEKAIALKSDGRLAKVRVHLGKSAALPKSWVEEFPTTGENSAVRVADNRSGIKILISPRLMADPENDSRLVMTLNTRVRDAMGSLVSTLERLEVGHAEVDFDLPAAQLGAGILGLEMALYRFKRCLKSEPPRFKLTLKHKGQAVSQKSVASALALGRGVNLARHLVNLPPNMLNPITYAAFVQDIFAGCKSVKVEVWDDARLAKENMGLLAAVGRGSETPPRLVHLRYRPAGGGSKKPIAFVGKGITFDSGGLDLKPAAGMRLMKKDMGGSASVLGLALWAVESGSKMPADFYLALAENSVGGRSFRPSDVVTARNGDTVEIHNTDAEGRLVLADALDVAITSKESPRVVIDVATLTGAIKVALGANLAGLFSNDNKLAASLQAAGLDSGDPMWGMPLFQKYKATFNTPFADLVNATEGFGGAITAALFLERFVGKVPWAHLDIYAWKDSIEGACLESGGSGQAVCALAEWVGKQRV